MRNFFAFCLCLFLVGFSYKITALASGTVNFSIATSANQLAQGETITITVSIDNVSSGVTGLEVPLIYDNSVFEVVSSSVGSVVNCDWKNIANFNHNTVKLTALSTSMTNMSNAGAIMAVEFRAKNDATVSSSTFQLGQCVASGNLGVTHTSNSPSVTVSIGLPITSISLDKNSCNLISGASDTLTLSAEPETGVSSKPLVWSSSNENIATVANGVVTAKNPGTCTITASIGNLSANCTYTVTSPMTGIALSNEKLTIVKDHSQNLFVNYYPSNTTDDRSVTWTSSDDKVATVKNGLVKALSKGEAVITAKVGEFSKTCKIKVIYVPLESIEFDKEELILNEGETGTLTVSFFPEDTTDSKNLTWTSSNISSATVEDGTITAIKEGISVITVEAGDVSKKIFLTINKSIVETPSPNPSETAIPTLTPTPTPIPTLTPTPTPTTTPTPTPTPTPTVEPKEVQPLDNNFNIACLIFFFLLAIACFIYVKKGDKKNEK